MKAIPLDPQIVDWVMPDLIGQNAPGAFIVYLFLWRIARGGNSWTAKVSYQGIADHTHLSKSVVQSAIRTLNRRRFIATKKETPTATPAHHVLRPWTTSRRRTGTPSPA
jgi:hypothetical protein